MTQQEIFNKVVIHLRTQGQTAKQYSGECMYLTGQGLSCAVGCLIPEELYDPEIEGRPVGSPSVTEILAKVGISRDSLALLQRLQTIHDNWLPTTWERLFHAVSVDFGLEVPKVLGCSA